MDRREALKLLGVGTPAFVMVPGELELSSWRPYMNENKEMFALLCLYGRVHMPSPDVLRDRKTSREEMIKLLDRRLADLKADWMNAWDARDNANGELPLAQPMDDVSNESQLYTVFEKEWKMLEPTQLVGA
jgi:hypothetical protein